jgi:hypothetical protein
MDRMSNNRLDASVGPLKGNDGMPARGELVAEYATKLGATWAQTLCDETRQQRRVVAGGFPGTIPEARQRVANFLRGELARLRLPPLEPEELSRAVEVAYARARRDWLDVGRTFSREG